jgi:hypothetical protein
MTEVPGIDRNQARDNVLYETRLVPEPVQDAEDDPRSTEEPTYRGGDQTGEGVKPAAGSRQPGARS